MARLRERIAPTVTRDEARRCKKRRGEVSGWWQSDGLGDGRHERHDRISHGRLEARGGVGKPWQFTEGFVGQSSWEPRKQSGQKQEPGCDERGGGTPNSSRLRTSLEASSLPILAMPRGPCSPVCAPRLPLLPDGTREERALPTVLAIAFASSTSA